MDNIGFPFFRQSFVLGHAATQNIDYLCGLSEPFYNSCICELPLSDPIINNTL